MLGNQLCATVNLTNSKYQMLKDLAEIGVNINKMGLFTLYNKTCQSLEDLHNSMN